MSYVPPTEVRLTLSPGSRKETIDVHARIGAEARSAMRRHRRALYCCPHTTAGYLEQGLSARLRHRGERLAQFVGAFGAVFPEGGEYRHDRMELRTELSEAQKQIEPRNADSHLTYIGAGIRNCVSYRTSAAPVYFIDLDGTSDAARRRRETWILPYDEERIVSRASVTVPMSGEAFDAVNLADPALGLIAGIDDLLKRAGIDYGRVDLSLGRLERGAALTVNEYETLLMRHDVMDALRSPLQFERMAPRLARSRDVSLPAAPQGGAARVVRGTYQSPILLQWQPARQQARRIDIAVVELSCRSVSMDVNAAFAEVSPSL